MHIPLLTSKPARARPTALLGVVLVLTLAGCAKSHMVRPVADYTQGVAVMPDIYALRASPVRVARTGRYQLVSLAPRAGERNLMAQIVSIDLPPSMAISVRDGMRHVLRDSGMRLCPTLAQAGLFAMGLPAVHRRLGPTTLRAALQAIAGPAWRLHVDYAARTVCFERAASMITTDHRVERYGGWHERA